MAMRGGFNRRVMSEINVTPLVDVMLVLLIVFMVTAPMLKSGVDVQLPTAGMAPLDKGERATAQLPCGAALFQGRIQRGAVFQVGGRECDGIHIGAPGVAT